MADMIHNIRWWCEAIYCGWFCLAMLVGIPWLLVDEGRLRRGRAKRADEDCRKSRD